MLLCLGFSICEIRTKFSSTHRVVLRFRCHNVYENTLYKYDYVISGFIKGWDLLCVCVCVHACVRSVVSGSLRPPWIVVRQAPLSMGLPRQEYWSVGCHFLLQVNLSDPGIESASFVSCIGRWVLYHCTTWEALIHCMYSPTMLYTSMNWKVRWTIYVTSIYNWWLEKKQIPVLLRTTPSSLRFCT